MIRKRNILFENHCYGDFSFTQVCALMSLRYNGALIFGDICDVQRRRINFQKVKSGFYENRKDKRLWYTPEVQWRELIIAYKFLTKMGIDEKLIDNLLSYRYREYLNRVVTEYRAMISRPENTVHYNLKISYKPFFTELKTIKNGLYLWRRMVKFCLDIHKKDLCNQVNIDTKQVFSFYLRILRG